jgi:hypothetical protein
MTNIWLKFRYFFRYSWLKRMVVPQSRWSLLGLTCRWMGEKWRCISLSGNTDGILYLVKRWNLAYFLWTLCLNINLRDKIQLPPGGKGYGRFGSYQKHKKILTPHPPPSADSIRLCPTHDILNFPFQTLIFNPWRTFQMLIFNPWRPSRV